MVDRVEDFEELPEWDNTETLKELDELAAEVEEAGREWIDPHHYCQRIERRLRMEALKN